MMRFVLATILLALSFDVFALSAKADGAALVAAGRAGPYQLSVLASPTPLRVGESEWSVLLLDASSGEAVLDANVELRVQPATAEHLHEHHDAHDPTRRFYTLSHAGSSNRLLYSVRVPLDRQGAWQLEIRAQGGLGSGDLKLDLSVGPARSPLLEYWQSFALPAIALLVLVLHQIRVVRSLPNRSRHVAAGTHGGAAAARDC